MSIEILFNVRLNIPLTDQSVLDYTISAYHH